MTSWSLRLAAVVAAASIGLAGCGGASGGGLPTSSGRGDPACGTTSEVPRWEHVVWIVLENRDASAVVDSPDAPYFQRLAADCGLAAGMTAIAHPSLPNYIAMVSGSTQGITDSAPPAENAVDAPSIFSQLGPGGWRVLMQSMPENCYREDRNPYVVRHNPPTYFTNLAEQCLTQSVPLMDPPDLSAPFTMVVPDQVNNTHDSDVATGDRWLEAFLPTVFATLEYSSGRTLVVVTFDEAEDDSPDNRIPTLVIAPPVPEGTVSREAFTHYSLLATTQELLGLPLLGEARVARSMRRAFSL